MDLYVVYVLSVFYFQGSILTNIINVNCVNQTATSALDLRVKTASAACPLGEA